MEEEDKKGEEMEDILVVEEHIHSPLFPSLAAPAPRFFSPRRSLKSYHICKRGGKDGVFQGLARRLQGISRGRTPRKNLTKNPFFGRNFFPLSQSVFQHFLCSIIICASSLFVGGYGSVSNFSPSLPAYQPTYQPTDNKRE